MADTRSDLGWWVIRGQAILAALRRTAAGENPDLVYAEMYVSSEHEYHGENPDWRGSADWGAQ